jgi:sigma-B regulation protein RsbQ
VQGVIDRNHVVVRGPDGAQPLVFAHGFGCDQAMWRFVAPSFEDRFRTVLYDQVGFGASDLAAFDAERHADLQGYATDLLEVLAELDLRDVVFVGHSVSAMIGVHAAVREPDRFAGLVLVCPSARYLDDPETGYVGGFSRADIDNLFETLDGNFLGWSRSMAPAIMGNPDRPELGLELTESFCRTDPAIASAFARVTFLSDSRDDLPRVRVPTLVLQTKQDVIADVPVGEYVRDHVPGSEMVLLDATGHCPNLSAPRPTVAAIEAFLDQLG